MLLSVLSAVCCLAKMVGLSDLYGRLATCLGRLAICRTDHAWADRQSLLGIAYLALNKLVGEW